VVEDRIGDIFEQQDLTHIVHQCNLFHCMGSGIAAEIARRFPEALAADKQTLYGDRGKLGTYSFCVVDPSLPLMQTRPTLTVINLYSQDGISAKHRTTHYAALGAALLHLERELSDFDSLVESPILGIPHGIGCGLAGGDWSIVRTIIESAFTKSPLRVIICRQYDHCPKCCLQEFARTELNGNVEYNCIRGHRWENAQP
jgi:O-acetyl-ADP-ribose deacetylase (regulator of RNase III)